MMAAPDFPNSPTVNQVYNAPNGVAYKWDGAVWTLGGPASGQPAGGDLSGTYPNPTVIPAARSKWTDTGTTLTPNVATRQVVVSGPSSGADAAQLVLGTTTAKSRIAVEPAAACLGRLDLMANAKVSATSTWLSDDPNKPSWLFALDPTGDNLGVWRAPATTGVPALTTMFSVDSTGQPTFAGPYIYWGPSPRALLQNYQGGIGVHANFAWGPDRADLPSWSVYPRIDTDQFLVYRRAPNAAAGSVTALLTVDNAGALTVPSYVQSKYRGCCRFLGAGVACPNGQTVNVNQWTGVISTGAGFSCDGTQMYFPAGIMCLVVASLSMDAAAGIVNLNQWTGSAWNTRTNVNFSGGANQTITWVSDSWGGSFYLNFTNISGATRTLTNGFFSVSYLGQL